MFIWSVFSAAAGVAVATGCYFALGRTDRSKAGHNPQALSVIGSVLVSSFVLVTAFLIAGSWSTYNADRQHIYDEARSTTVAYWLAGKLPTAEGAQVRSSLVDYVHQVTTEEWPLLAKGRTSEAAWTTLDNLRTTVAALKPADASAETARDDVASALDDLYARRQVRTADVNYTIPSLIYAALIVAALLLIGYPTLVGMTANTRNVLLLAGFGAMIGLGVYIVFDLSHPFGQPLELHPTAFQLALDRFAQIASQGAVPATG
jgi:Protein of unknown function (DUF4239)